MSARFNPTTLKALEDSLPTMRERAERALEAALPADDVHPRRLHEAMRYAVLGGGKRMRPVLVYAAGQALGYTGAALDGPACAVEMIHAYSLVHDDLPAMDDDELRRGQPTCHRAYDEPTAILVGDALQSQAFETLARSGEAHGVPAAARTEMITCLARAVGSQGMVGGQAIDLSAVGRTLDATELEEMHGHKTGALIRACVQLGALASGCTDTRTREALDRYASRIGLAFQIHDDVLDIEGDAEALGKEQGADAARDKPTYPSILGLDHSRELAERLAGEAIDALQGLEAGADCLRGLAAFCIQRRA
ncbi:MAG: polyprenyl synthetase family protein [Halorhodospira sp.]